jgi:hypothetical protein
MSEELESVLEAHALWMNGEGGARADMCYANLRRANLRDANLRDSDLGGADMRGAYLSGADLRDSDLRDANLRNADLRDADLRDADMRGADMRGAYMVGACLIGADMREANLRNANMCDADLNGAHLHFADLEGARLPDGWVWWQGGAEGPNRRMLRCFVRPDRPGYHLQAGCINLRADTVDEVVAAYEMALREDRADAWGSEAMIVSAVATAAFGLGQVAGR